MTNIKFLQNTLVFKGMHESEIKEALKTSHAFEKNYQKGNIILCSGEKTECFGLVLDGKVFIETMGSDGQRTVIGMIGPKQVFAETFAFFHNAPLMMDVIASTDVCVLILNLQNIISYSSPAEWHEKILMNLLTISNRKNLQLASRNIHTSPKSLRGRILSYLRSRVVLYGSKSFDIPFDREQLADYLNADRSALSRELSRMQKEGILSYHKNHFEILK